MKSVRILAPAKVNLGLAVLGKRPDGMHEIDTIMTMVGLCDEITIQRKLDPGILVSGMEDVSPADNLVTKAAIAWAETANVRPAFNIQIHKRIPSPGGLGGGSSDAAATLRALNVLADNPLPHATLHSIAERLGADCPFFLGTAAARATGTGTILTPLPAPHGYVVLIVPRINMLAKTATLYGGLRPEDFHTSDQIALVCRELEQSHDPEVAQLTNSFDHVAGHLMPTVSTSRQELVAEGIDIVLSGAGPGLFATAKTEDTAREIATKAASSLSHGARIWIAPFLAEPPSVEFMR